METLVAYHGNPEVKAKYIARVRHHRKMDNLTQGRGWDGGRGCAIGCTLEAYDHARYPIELGISVILARLEDRIFEGLPKSYAMKWPELFLRAIRPGADLSLITPKILLWMLVDRVHGVRKHATDQGKAAIDLCADMLQGWITTGTPDRAAANAANAAADAAYAAAYAADAAANAADAAAYAAADAAADAAYAAANAADAAAYAADAAANAADAAAYAADAARESFYVALGSEVLRLLKSTTVAG